MDAHTGLEVIARAFKEHKQSPPLFPLWLLGGLFGGADGASNGAVAYVGGFGRHFWGVD